MSGRLIWVCALACEARPIIDRYRLKKSRRDHAFDLYENPRMACIVSGVGRLACAAATAWCAARFDAERALAWLNVGIAGAADFELGTLLQVVQIVDADSGRHYYPMPTAKPALPTAACLSLARPGNEYPPGFLLDMEASGFAASALRFSSAELVGCLKVVSDNPRAHTGRDRGAVSALIERRLDAIDTEAMRLLALADEVGGREIDPADWHALLAAAPFSETEQNRLRTLARYLLNREFDRHALLARMHAEPTRRAKLESLARLCHDDSAGL